MRIINLVLIAALLTSMACGSQKGKVNEGVQFEIMAVHDYCGGAPPSEEILEALRTPKPLEDTLYIHRATDRMRDTLVGTLVLEKGKAQVTWLNPGKYVAFERAKVEMVEGIKMDELAHCRMMMNNHPFFHFTIAKDTKLVTDTVPVQCDPCMPPMP